MSASLWVLIAMIIVAFVAEAVQVSDLTTRLSVSERELTECRGEHEPVSKPVQGVYTIPAGYGR